MTDITTYHWDNMRRLMKVEGADPDEGSAIGTAAPITEYKYDADGRLDKMGELGLVQIKTYYDYDPAGRLVKTTDHAGGFVQTVYDAARRASHTVDGEGRVTQLFNWSPFFQPRVRLRPCGAFRVWV